MQPQCDSREPPGDDRDVGGPPHNENSSIALRVRSQATHALVVERAVYADCAVQLYDISRCQLVPGREQGSPTVHASAK